MSTPAVPFDYAVLLFLIFVRKAESQAPTITASPNAAAYVVEGQNITLEWTYNVGGSAFRELEFIQATDTINILDKSASDGLFIYPDFCGRVLANTTETNAKITFLNVSSRTDHKTYRLQVENQARQSALNFVQMMVQGPPSLKKPLAANQVVTEGDPATVTLTCEADGFPPPNILWTKVFGNGSDSNVLFSGTQYEFSNNRTNAGTYRCTAENGIGSAVSQTVNVTVNLVPENVLLVANETRVCQNDVVSFICSANANAVVHTYQLYENNMLIDSSSSGVWRRTMSPGGVFKYICMANSTVGTANSTSSVSITVNVHPSIQPIQNETVTEGGNVTLLCNASSVPLPSVSWVKVSSGERFNGRELMLTNISRNQDGEYRCDVSNECGNASESSNIGVQFNPEDVRLRIFATGKKACLSDTLNVTCTTIARPDVLSFHLFENDKLLRKSSQGTWNIPLSTSGVFTYKCMANNSLGTANSTTDSLNVGAPSSIQPIPDETAIEGGIVTLYCNASGVPPPSVSWSGYPGHGKELVFAHINRNKTGEYRCDGTNRCGNASKIARVNVQYAPKITHISGSQTLNKGDQVSLNCTADGNPAPNVTWTRLSDNSVVTFPLTINGKQDEGNYRCTADNGVGNPVIRDTSITVHLTRTEKIVAGIVFKNEEFKPEYEDLNNGETIKFVQKVEKACTEELTGIGLTKCKVTRLRKGSVVADLELTFSQSVSQGDVDALVLEATRDGKLGELEVSEIKVGGPIEDSPTAVPSEPETLNKDVIYGPVIGVLAVLLISFVIYLVIKHQRGQRHDRQKPNFEEISGSHFNAGNEIEGDNDNVNASNPRHYMELRNVTQSQGRLEGSSETPLYLEINEYAPLHPATRSWEVSRENVIIVKLIGQGAFGQVAQGRASQPRGREGTTTVAIKMLKDNAPESDKKDLLSELEVMKTLKPHPHVIKLLGCVTESEPILVIIEYVPYGDLLGYLRKSRGMNDTYYKDPDVKPQTSLTSLQLMKFSWQVADGMSYLSSRNIIHRDLAARNVLVGEGETCKVTDFGMARDVQQEKIYEKKTKGRIPVKWTAYEALVYGRYTTKSDVWSFGVVLYENFTIGGSPYPRTKGQNMVELLLQGYRMPKPNHLNDALYQIMLSCWHEDPDNRPTFENLRSELKRMENQHKRLINMEDYDKKLYENVEDLMF